MGPTAILMGAGIASFLFVFLRAFQQLNVMHSQYLAVVPTSILMASCEVFVVANVAASGWRLPLVLSVGLGGGLGCICSMYIHSKLRSKYGR